MVLRTTLRASGVLALLAIQPAHAAEAIRFKEACSAGTRVVVAAVGDLLFHAPLQQQALTPNGSYQQSWQGVRHILQDADLTYGNLEGSVAAGVNVFGRAVKDPGKRADGYVYTTRTNEMIFNYHASLVADLKASGFDIVSTANNHASDRGLLGIDRTIDALEEGGLPFSGTRRTSADGSLPWSRVVSAKGVNIAFLACTYGTNNGLDRKGQILNCYRDKDVVMSEIKWRAQDPEVDAVVLTPHWGNENWQRATASDRAYARDAIAAGASAIIGAHPHVLQPWEKIVTESGREGLVIYSTGNFISSQPWTPNRSGIVALLEFTKRQGEKARLTAAGYVPTWAEQGRFAHQVTELKEGQRGLAGPLAATLKLLPTDNRVKGDNFRNLLRDCETVADGAATQ